MQAVRSGAFGAAGRPGAGPAGSPRADRSKSCRWRPAVRQRVRSAKILNDYATNVRALHPVTMVEDMRWLM